MLDIFLFGIDVGRVREGGGKDWVSEFTVVKSWSRYT